MEINILDVIIGLILAYAGFKGFKNGLIVELATIAALLLGVWGSVVFSEVVAEILKTNFQLDSDHTGIIAFILTFILIVIGIHILAKVISKLLDAVALGVFNRIAGLLFGGLKFVLVISIFLMFLTKMEYVFKLIPDETKSKSIFYGPVEQFAPNILPFFEFDEVKKRIDDKLDKA